MARKKQNVMVLFPDLFMGARKLTDAQFGALVRALYAYRFEGEEYIGEDMAISMAFDFAKPQVDRYMKICETNRINKTGANGQVLEETQTQEMPEAAWEDDEVQHNTTESHEMQRNDPQIQTQNQIQTQDQIQIQNQKQKESKKETVADKPPTPTGFIPPTVEQVRQYATASGYFVDSQRFVDYYTSIGWMVGKAKMKDWKAAVRNWSGKENGNGKAEAKPLWTIGTVL